MPPFSPRPPFRGRETKPISHGRVPTPRSTIHLMESRKKGRKVALVAGLALVVLSVGMVWKYRKEIRSWYAFRRDFESLGRNAQGYPEYWHAQTGIVFVRLPGGTFEMGSPETETRRREIEGPVHKVRLSPFLIAKYGAPGQAWERGKSCRAT